MFQGTESIWLPFEPKQTYLVAETYPTFVRFFLKGSKIIEQNDLYMVVEVHARLLNFLPSRWKGEGEKVPFQRINFTQTEGLFKGLKAEWLFEEAGNGTQVSIKTRFEKPNIGSFGEWLLGKFVVERTTRKILQELSWALKASRTSTIQNR